MFSTNGRYALRVMVDLAEHMGQGHIRLDDIAKRQGLSKSYISNIMAKLSKAGLVDGKRGAYDGGVKLIKEPKEYTVAEILVAANEKLAPVACLSPGAAECPRVNICSTRKMWEEYAELTSNFLTSRTLADLARVTPAEQNAEESAAPAPDGDGE